MSHQRVNVEHRESIIIGAGPAGLQMGYFFENEHRDYLILERSDCAGSFFASFPKQRTLLSINKHHNFYDERDFNLRHDWNSLLCDDPDLQFPNYSKELYPRAEDLQRYLVDFATRYSLKIVYRTRVCAIGKNKNHFIIREEHGKLYTCDRLFIATGAVAPNNSHEIDGIEHCIGYEDCDLDTTRFENKRVAIIGRGNSAFEVADHLANHAAIVHLLVGEPIRFAWQTHYVGDLRAVNNSILDMYQLKSLHAALGFQVQKIEKNQDGTLSTTVKEDMPHWKSPSTAISTLVYDFIIRATGWKFVDPNIFESDCVPEFDKDAKYPILSNNWESSIRDMYFIGTSMGSLDRKSTSGFIHGFRYNIRTLSRLTEELYHGTQLPSETFHINNEADLTNVADFIINRVSTTSALYQLNGFQCDVLVVSDRHIQLFYELGVDYALERFADAEYLCLLTLEYGFQHYSKHVQAVEFVHPADQDDIKCSAFLHPVLRVVRNGKTVDEALLGESLTVRYDHYDYEQNLEDLNRNTLKNLFNRIFRVTDKVFSETKYAAGSITPWSREQIQAHRQVEPLTTGEASSRCRHR